MLGGANGFHVLRRFKEELPETQVVLMTGHGTALGALDATAFGAYDYLLKPFGVDDLVLLLQALRERLSLSTRCLKPKKEAVAAYSSDLNLIGRSQAFIEIMKQVGRVAVTNLPVLITGESGTGKEVVAHAIHKRSPRAGKPFVAVNCGALTETLLEAELFGHTRGAFTGAERDRQGLFEEAQGGTIFLDEITETSPAFQVKLLRVLQEGEVRRVGANRTQHVDVRVVAASNRDVKHEVEEGRFRQDLFYRLNAVTLYLPPLRERREDIFPLVNNFAQSVWKLNPSGGFTPEALRLLEQYHWPGNIRELENTVVRAVALSNNIVRPEDLPEHIRNYQHASEMAAPPVLDSSDVRAPIEWLTFAEMEKRYVTSVLEHTKGNKQAAARLLDVDRKTIERMIKRHDIPDVKSLLGSQARSLD
jgi:DNA-binding NtrC family response regulator